MSSNVKQYTLQELWGCTEDEYVKPVKPKRNKLLCIYIGNKQYYASNEHGPMIVTGMDYADIFFSEDEAEQFLNRHCLQGDITEYRGCDKEMLENAYNIGGM